MVNASTYYANESGLWFIANAPVGPWALATSVPPAIYTIPPSSPIYDVTSCYAISRWRWIPWIPALIDRGAKCAVLARLAKLMPREFEVFRGDCRAAEQADRCGKLGIILRATKTHRARVLQKMGVVSVADLVRLAQKAVTPVPYGP